MARVNFKATQQDFVPLPNGSYLVEIESMELAKSSTNNDMIKTMYKLVVPLEGFSKKLFDNFSLQVQAGWKLKNMLEAAQVPHTAIPGMNKGDFELDFDTGDAIGRRLIVRMEQETFLSNRLDENGKQKAGIRSSVEEYIQVAL